MPAPAAQSVFKEDRLPAVIAMKDTHRLTLTGFLTIKSEKVRIRVVSFRVKVTDNFRRDEAECDPVSAVAQGKVAVWELGARPDQRQSVLRFGKCSRPAAGGFHANSREHRGEFPSQFPRLGGDQTVATI